MLLLQGWAVFPAFVPGADEIKGREEPAGQSSPAWHCDISSMHAHLAAAAGWAVFPTSFPGADEIEGRERSVHGNAPQPATSLACVLTQLLPAGWAVFPTPLPRADAIEGREERAEQHLKLLSCACADRASVTAGWAVFPTSFPGADAIEGREERAEQRGVPAPPVVETPIPDGYDQVPSPTR